MGTRMSAPGSPPGKNLAAAIEGWPGAVPDWVETLARACDADSQSAVATRVGLSPSAINSVVRGRYPASTDRIEQLVRGHLMSAVVPCPVLGDLQADLCQEWQGRATRAPASAFHRRMAAGCRACPHSRLARDRAA